MSGQGQGRTGGQGRAAAPRSLWSSEPRFELEPRFERRLTEEKLRALRDENVRLSEHCTELEVLWFRSFAGHNRARYVAATPKPGRSKPKSPSKL